MGYILHSPMISSAQCKVLCILDNGHSTKDDTSRKSPDITFDFGGGITRTITGVAESLQNRILVKYIINHRGKLAILELYPETEHTTTCRGDSNGVSERIKRINQAVKEFGSQYDYIYCVSMHTNASTKGATWSSEAGYYVLCRQNQNSLEIKKFCEERCGGSFSKILRRAEMSTSIDIQRIGLLSSSSNPVDTIVAENGFHTNKEEVMKWMNDTYVQIANSKKSSIDGKTPLARFDSCLANQGTVPIWKATDWVRHLGDQYVQAFTDIADNYQDFLKRTPVATKRRIRSSESVDVPEGKQNATPETRTDERTIFILVSKDLTNSKTASIKEILNYYYDFTDDNGKNKSGKDKINLDDEIEWFLETNFERFYVALSLKDKVRLMKLDQENYTKSDVPTSMTYSDAKNQYSGLVDEFKNNAILGISYLFKSKCLNPVLLKTQDEEFLDSMLDYKNPYMELEQQAHLDEQNRIIKDGKEFPRVFAWCLPQASSLVEKGALVLHDDILSASFGRSLRGSATFSLNLAPVRGLFVKDESGQMLGKWVKDSQNASKRMFEEEDIYYAKVINPGDLIYISTLNVPLDAGNELETLQLPKGRRSIKTQNGGSTEFSVDFVGVVDKVKTTRKVSNQVSDTITISGRSLLKFYEQDTVFFQTANMGYSKDMTDPQGYITQSNLKVSAETEGLLAQQTTKEDFSKRIANTWNDLKDLISCPSVSKTLHKLMDRLKVLPQEYKFSNGSTVSVTNMILRDFDQNLQYRTYYASRLATMEGSIMNFLNQLTPSPFIEIWGDTYPPMTQKELDNYSALNGSAWVKYDDPAIKGEESNYQWDESQIFHLIVRNAPLQFSEFMNLPFINLDSSFITEWSAEITDSEMFSAFQVVPRMAFTSERANVSQAFPAILFPILAKHYGFRIKKIESSYFAQRQGANNSRTPATSNLFTYAEKDLRQFVKYALGNAFYETGQVTTLPLKHIHPGMRLMIKTSRGAYHAYITDVKYQYSAQLQQCKTVISYERGMYGEGHSIVHQLADFALADNYIEHYKEADARKVEFYVDQFERLLSKTYAYSAEKEARVVVKDVIQIK